MKNMFSVYIYVYLKQTATKKLDPDRCESCYGAETGDLK